MKGGTPIISKRAYQEALVATNQQLLADIDALQKRVEELEEQISLLVKDTRLPNKDKLAAAKATRKVVTTKLRQRLSESAARVAQLEAALRAILDQPTDTHTLRLTREIAREALKGKP